MTDLDQFVKDAIRTESVIHDVNTDFAFLQQLLTALINLGSVLDQVKKNVFYGKPFKEGPESIAQLIHDTQVQLQEMMTSDGSPTTCAVNVIDPRVFHGVVGIATESTELLEALSTAIFERGKNLDNVNVGEELGDVDWYKAILCDALGISWDNTLSTVIDKLRVRFPDKFDSDKAINRDLATERTVLENNHNKRE